MDFDFSDDQLALREAVQRWADKAYPFDARRARVAAGGLDAGVYRELAELGLCGLLADAEHDGMDMGPVEAMLAMEALGAVMLLEPLDQTLLASALLRSHGLAEAQAQWQGPIARGEVIPALALHERGQRYATVPAQTQAQGSGNQITLTGGKHVVRAAAQAQLLLVSALYQGTPALFAVTAGASGMRVGRYALQDGSAAGDVHFEATPATLVCADATQALAMAQDLGVALACARGVGAMEATLRITAEYLNTRKQFGVPIGQFQALRHRLADMKMALELARSMSYYATLKVQAPAAERRQAMARAKVQLGRSMRQVGQEAVQLHGGIAVTDEYVIGHYFKYLTQLELSHGDTLHHLGAVSDSMQASAGVFV
ncbi:MAG: acyl-CoA dehydrogenase family protein [Burkholderiaceae bacterium]|jgi:alkylation response protein AidB-like acyl-CoA dehydrogenase